MLRLPLPLRDLGLKHLQALLGLALLASENCSLRLLLLGPRFHTTLLRLLLTATLLLSTGFSFHDAGLLSTPLGFLGFLLLLVLHFNHLLLRLLSFLNALLFLRFGLTLLLLLLTQLLLHFTLPTLHRIALLPRPDLSHLLAEPLFTLLRSLHLVVSLLRCLLGCLLVLLIKLLLTHILRLRTLLLRVLLRSRQLFRLLPKFLSLLLVLCQ